MDATPIAEARKFAEESFSAGFFCAESVVLALAEAEESRLKFCPG